MAERSLNIATPLTFGFLELRQVPALVYWMPSKSGHGAIWSELRTVQEAIEQAGLLEQNWDGYGALNIAHETKENAIQGIRNVLLDAPAPEISPNPNGTLSFEWESQKGTAHMEVGQTTFSFYINPLAGTPIMFGGPAGQISRLHGNLLAGLLFPPTNVASATTPITYSTDV